MFFNKYLFCFKGYSQALSWALLNRLKFGYSPLSKIFTKRLDKNDQKEGLFKRLKNIEDKNEEQLKLFSKVNKTSKFSKNESDHNYDNNKFS